MSNYFYPLGDIIVLPNRQRTQIATKDVRELADRIHATCNLHLPGVWFDENERPVLVFGERRFRAITLLASEEKTYRLPSGVEVPLGQICVTEVDADSLLLRKELEFDENTQRVDYVWADRIKALAEIHELKKKENPTQTVAQTASEIAKKTGVSAHTLAHAAPSMTSKPVAVPSSIPVALLVAPHLNNPEVAKASSLQSAFATVSRIEEEKAVAALVAKRKARGALTGELVELRHGDARKLLLLEKDNTFDLVLVDPPYGINADEENFSRKQAQKHTYSDDPNAAREFMQFLLLEGFRCAKSRANLFMFFDIKHYEWLDASAKRAGWSPFPVPLVWDKLSPGLGPWQNTGFGRSYELIFFATKGRRGLVSTERDVLPAKRVRTEDRTHAAQKPDELLRRLIQLSTFPGDYILDPCAGSGSTLVAARALQRKALGFELDLDLFNGAQTNLFKKGKDGGAK